MKLLLSAFMAAWFASPSPAQCQFATLSQQSLGDGCNAVSTGFCALAAPPTLLGAQLDAATCQLTLTVNAFEFCGATVPLVALALGTQPASVPLPEFGGACTLHVIPIVVLASTGTSFALPIPAGLSSLSFAAQGLAWSHAPWGTDVVTLSDALAISLL